MPERPRPQEGQPPPMVQAIEATKEFVEKIEEHETFKKARNSVLGKLGNISPEAKENAGKMVKSGTGMAMQRIGLLPAFANPEKRKEILEQFKQEKVEGAWIDILASWNVASDPNGIGVLEACKKNDIAEIKSKISEAENDEQKAQIQIQADAISKGQDIVINFYKKKLSSKPQKAAA